MTGRSLLRDFDTRRSRLGAEKVERRIALRQAWRALLADASRLAERLIASDGEEAVHTLHLRHDSKRFSAVEFPAQGDSARQAADAFKAALNALFDAGLPRRKALLAPMVAAGAKALTDLITEEQTREADAWRKQTGEEA